MKKDIFAPSPGPGKDPYIVFECGSCYPVITLKAVEKNGRKCPVCGCGLLYKLIRCEMCEKWMVKHSRVSHCRHCQACAKIERKLYQRRVAAAAKIPAPPTPIKKPSKKAKPIRPKICPDCYFYLTKCLPEAAHKPDGRGRVNCRNCPDYTPFEMHATVTGTGNDLPFDNHGCTSHWGA